MAQWLARLEQDSRRSKVQILPTPPDFQNGNTRAVMD